MSNVSIELTNEDAELFKEFCRQHELYTAIIQKVVDNPGGNVTLHIDENGVIRRIQTSRTFIIT
jgi:hypothetical protein